MGAVFYLKDMKVKIKKLHPEAIIPTYATDGSGCFDIYSTSDGVVRHGQAQAFTTGIAFEIPKGYVMKIYSRSGHGFKNGIRLANGTGIIDSDYRGELLVKLHNDSQSFHFHVSEGMRIAQGIVVKADRVEFEEAEELSETDRGEGGFGSTGR